MPDAVTEINIDNPLAKEAFVRWWRTMEAQGYQYGFEALCNVWVGFDDGRADLAKKVLEVVDLPAVRELFIREGVNIAHLERRNPSTLKRCGPLKCAKHNSGPNHSTSSTKEMKIQMASLKSTVRTSRTQSLLTESMRLKAEAYQYQVMRFGNYRPQKPLSKAIARAGKRVTNLDGKPISGVASAP